MIYSVELGSGGTIYIPSFIRIGPGIQKSLEEDTHTDAKTHRHTDRKAISKFFFIFTK
jgi:hypothetical protein